MTVLSGLSRGRFPVLSTEDGVSTSPEGTWIGLGPSGAPPFLELEAWGTGGLGFLWFSEREVFLLLSCKSLGFFYSRYMSFIRQYVLEIFSPNLTCHFIFLSLSLFLEEIGRASCRERVSSPV